MRRLRQLNFAAQSYCYPFGGLQNFLSASLVLLWREYVTSLEHRESFLVQPVERSKVAPSNQSLRCGIVAILSSYCSKFLRYVRRTRATLI